MFLGPRGRNSAAYRNGPHCNAPCVAALQCMQAFRNIDTTKVYIGGADVYLGRVPSVRVCSHCGA